LERGTLGFHVTVFTFEFWLGYSFPKIKYKGAPTSTVIRKEISGFQKRQETSTEFIEKLVSQQTIDSEQEKVKVATLESPKYTIVYSKDFETTDFTNSKDIQGANRIDNVVVRIKVPKLVSAGMSTFTFYLLIVVE
jgi:hypothetical protein